MSTPLSRRAVLGSAAGVGVAGALGAWAAPASASGAPTTWTTADPVATGTARGRRAVGDTFAHDLALLDVHGATIGRLVVSGTVLAARGAATDLASVQHHLLRLAGGTLAAHGTVDLAGHGEFVVVGGTGAHRGATGSYLLRPGPGRGSTLTWEARP